MTLLEAISFVIIIAAIDGIFLRLGHRWKSHSHLVAYRVTSYIFLTGFSIIDTIAMGMLSLALHDQVINLIWGKSIFYLGSEADWDKYWKTKPIALYILAKIISLIIAIWILWK